jgi:hypothetical protein
VAQPTEQASPKPLRVGFYPPPSANRPRLRRMVKPTLKMMLTTIQNRHLLPNRKCLSRGQLHLEHHVFHDRFQVG